ncbi:hypothetical protein FRC04_003833 [Tulasnella sp. 424]|nr:hypothetical protein FRC04_003833 [Tulasnella sp. 424]
MHTSNSSSAEVQRASSLANDTVSSKTTSVPGTRTRRNYNDDDFASLDVPNRLPTYQLVEHERYNHNHA